MKRILIYTGLLAAGLLLGYWIFSSNSTDVATTTGEDHDHESVTQMWTCSMHPQILQPEPGQCPICGMDLIPAESGSEGLAADQFKMTENAMALANIQTTAVGGGVAGDNKLKLSGKIQVNEEANAVQVSYFSGRIERLNISFTGEKVNRGQLLATIYSPELVAAQQELLTASKMKENQPSLYKAVRNKLKLWKLSDKQIDAIETAGQVKENFPVYATVSGTVTEKMVQEGDYVKQGQPLYKIANLKSVWAVFDAYENQIKTIREGQKIKVTTNAYPDKEFDATVSFIDPVLNTSKRTVLIRAVLDNKKDIFKPGMFVQAELKAAGETSAENVVSVPKSAVLWTGERSLVYVKPNPAEPVFEMREIKLGRSVGDTYEVLSGLNNGEEIVVNGTFTVDAAAQLQGKKSMMNASAGMSDDPSQMKMKLPDTFQKDFTTVLNAYFGLKDAFVASQVETVKTKAQKMLKEVKNLRTNNLGAMEVSHINEMNKMLKAITENDVLENQRNHFVILSRDMIAFASNLDKVEIPVFVHHCPMANTNKGADWLSLSQEVKNPYYGDAMMTCGEVVKEIR